MISLVSHHIARLLWRQSAPLFIILATVIVACAWLCVLPANSSRGYSRSLTGSRSESPWMAGERLPNAALTGQWFLS
jgi:hypothetical protein